MANFPALKTGAVAQYGSDRTRQFSTQVLRFLDGSEQRFQDYGAPLWQWMIRLSLLDEAELTKLELFFEDEGGRAGNFSFTDPWDGTVYANCSFGNDDLATQFDGVARGQDASDGEGEPELDAGVSTIVNGRGGALSGDQDKAATNRGEHAGGWEHGRLCGSRRGESGLGVASDGIDAGGVECDRSACSSRPRGWGSRLRFSIRWGIFCRE